MDSSREFEVIRSKWMTGRGTKVLYLAVALLLWGAVGSGVSSYEAGLKADTAVSNTIVLAQAVKDACADEVFYSGHVSECVKAAKIAKAPTSAEDGAVVSDASVNTGTDTAP